MSFQEIIGERLNKWLTPEHIENFMTDLFFSAATLLVTFLLIKIISKLLDLALKESGTGGEENNTTAAQRFFSDNILRSVRVLLKTMLLYGGYFMAGIIILEIFDVKVISPEDLKSLGVKILKVIGVLVGAKLVINLGHMTVKQAFERHGFNENFKENRRLQTLEVLLRSVLTYIVFFMAVLMILQAFNVNASAILASAGILGLAIGFGAQNLVKDVISGFFILFEDQFSVGDYVETAGVVGTVEEIGLRTCKIRQWTGQLHVIPNGEITRVTNYNRGNMVAVVTVSIAFEEDIDKALDVLRQECAKAVQEIETIVEDPLVQGVTDLADSSVKIRVTAATVPGEHWAVERELRRRFKYALDRAGIEIPYPRRVLYQRGDGRMKEENSRKDNSTGEKNYEKSPG